ncbi:MAG TPA: oligosaccharide flippase family protein [Solirubrobacteraceae bacterium]|nr:oligosaccharide flippase family protein [Solirubrobacteraceae bacterium]
MSGRFLFPREELRARTVRGALVTGAFLIGIDALVVAQGLIVTRLLGPELIGLYGIVTVTTMTIVALKRVGIDEAFVQQDEAGPEEEEFQRAFTLELGSSVAFALVLCALAPLVAAVYGDDRLLGLMLATSYLPIAFALQAPLWVFFRRMEYGRQRALQAIQPVVSFAVTVPLAATDFGVWALVVGPLCGYVVAVGAAIAVSPYRLGLRWDRDAARRYVGFSAWILVATLATLVVQQGQVLAFDLTDGLAWVGFLTLAITVTRYVDRADQIVTATIYPAIAAIKGRTRTLEELFVKSNRATMLWVLPFTVALILFAGDLVSFVVGEEWRNAELLIQGLAAAGLLQHLGFNWFSFYRAHGDTRPPALEAVVVAVAFVALAVPGLVAWGAEGFVAGRIASVALGLVVRARYVRRMLPRVRVRALVGPALPPLLAAGGLTLAVRLALWGGGRPAWQAAVEVAVFVATFAVLALPRERALLAELRGAVRRGQQEAGEDGGDERHGGHLPVPVDR